MKLLRWNNAQGPQGKSVEPSASHSGQGLEVRKRFLPVEGEIFSLTFPFIDQAVTVRREKALVHSGVKDPPGNWIAPPGNNRSGGGDNKAAGASGVEGRIRRLGESVGCNTSER
jgi:hypothetical protein